ncbi:DUF402 domain-containing protein [Natronobacterium gregoryi]|uniref:Probable ribonuclease FAU-1 n=2 Tax=Natronobacterium gregoryi TaxID=44930 RepID=L0AEY2_NATGS|nr:DUF402 domain-containing protein [Natronobacterium gregoryi]AFZ72406.1 Protein of unknown function (DUF402) [Natronobacterium gregoryi SP2]ELY70682.1 RNA-binding protein AU-1 [Natronobacterium gregoryi SP2]PLK18303.1 DUF402 domain-containing protein [Natronobacterium gregoryi SP2]SFJ69208.1 RNA-binding protein AU-1 [Natronobacterium gregoryi]
MTTNTTARVRGIYTTAITRLLEGDGFEVVQASEPIQERFDDEFDAAPADILIETTRDRQGVEVTGAPDAVAAVLETLEDVGIDTFRWEDETPRGAVFDGEVIDAAGGSGAVVDLGDGRRGYLKYDDVDGYVDDGDRYRLQVREPTPPWDDDDEPRVSPTLAVNGGLCTLSQDRTGVSASTNGEKATELVGMTDLLSPSRPEGWGLRWKRPATDADLEAMAAALERATERVEDLEATIDDAPAEPGEPGRLTAPRRTAWCWFGRESRFALDDHRREVESTMAGHHRIKAADRAASAAVDFTEAVCGSAGENTEFPFDAVSHQFGPTTGDRLEIGHGKPDGRRISLGDGDVTEWDVDGSITLERSMRGGGSYDALGVPKEEGDVAVTKFREGRWWYPTTYKSADGETKGTYVNVCTPVELFPDAVRYVDLYVDVIRTPDGTVEIVDDEELETKVEAGLVSEPLAEKARSVATAVERALSK